MSKYVKIDRRLKAKWVRALRSGKWRQTTGQAFDRTTSRTPPRAYCCIGVGGAKAVGARPGRVVSLGDTMSAGLACGLDHYTVDHLVTLNDKKEWNFKKIATWIEKYL